MIDEHSCLWLAIRAGGRCKAKDVVELFEYLTSVHPPQAFIRSYNIQEFIAIALWNWCETSNTASIAYNSQFPPRSTDPQKL